LLKNGNKSKWKCNLNYGENETCVNEWNMQDEILNGSLQTKQNRRKETTTKKCKKWNGNVPSKIACSFFKYGGIIIWMQFVKFFCVNDDNEVLHKNFQVMRCLIYYDIHVHASKPSTKERNGLITYKKTYERIDLKNHVDGDHAIIGKNIEEEVNGLIRGILEGQTTKTRPNVSNFAIFKVFLSSKILFKRMMNNKMIFCKTLAF